MWADTVTAIHGSRVLLEKLLISSVKKIPCVSWNARVRYRFNNSPLFLPTLSWINLIYTFSIKINFNNIPHLTSSFSGVPFQQVSPPKLCRHCSSPTHTLQVPPPHTHIIFLVFITRIIFCEDNQTWRSSSSSSGLLSGPHPFLSTSQRLRKTPQASQTSTFSRQGRLDAANRITQ